MSPRSAPSTLDLTFAVAAGARYVPFVRKHLGAAHALLAPALGELSVAFVGDRRMAELHARFMGVSGPTDVLTFPLDHDRRGRVVGGEVVVCVAEAVRRARRGRARPARKARTAKGRGDPEVARELLLYALHGMLHLCGFDDRTDAAYRKMHRTEDDILSRLGVGRVFEPRPGDDRLAPKSGNQPPARAPRRAAPRRARGPLRGDT